MPAPARGEQHPARSPRRAAPERRRGTRRGIMSAPEPLISMYAVGTSVDQPEGRTGVGADGTDRRPASTPVGARDRSSGAIGRASPLGLVREDRGGEMVGAPARCEPRGRSEDEEEGGELERRAPRGPVRVLASLGGDLWCRSDGLETPAHQAAGYLCRSHAWTTAAGLVLGDSKIVTTTSVGALWWTTRARVSQSPSTRVADDPASRNYGLSSTKPTTRSSASRAPRGRSCGRARRRRQSRTRAMSPVASSGRRLVRPTAGKRET